MLLFILSNIIVILSALRLTGRFFASYSAVDALIAGFILYFSQIVFTQLCLGLFSVLTILNLLFLNLAILLIVRFTLPSPKSPFKDKRELLDTLFSGKLTIFCFFLIVGFVSVKISMNLANPPFGWDSLNYHYTFAVEWLKNANLNNPIVNSDDPFPSYYPVNGSLWYFWLIFPFKSAFMADLGQLPFYIISLLALYSILRKLEVKSESAFFAACLFAFIPNFFKQLQIGYVDIMVAGLFLCALNSILALKEKFGVNNVVLFALAFGLFAGTKTVAISYAVFLLIPFLYLIFSQRQAGPGEKALLTVLSLALASCFGGFSYIRNFLLTGNPLYPLEITMMGRTVFHGVIDRVTYSARNEVGAYSLAKLLFKEGTGAQTLLIVLPATLLSWVVNFFKNKKKDFLSNYLMFLPLALYLAFRFTVPLPNARYLYPMFGAGLAVGFYCLSGLKVSAKFLRPAVAVLLIASSFECSRRSELIVSWGLSLSLWGVFIFLSKRRLLSVFLFSKRVAIVTAVLFLVFLQFMFLDYKKNEYMRYILNSRYWPEATAAWAWMNEHTKGDNIAYVGRPVPYPLYGSGLKNNVYYVSVNSVDPVSLYDFKGAKYRWKDAEGMHESFTWPGNYRGNADYSAWLGNLKRRNTDLLFIYSLHHTRETVFPLEEGWACAHPERFAQVFANQTIRIYQIKK